MVHADHAILREQFGQQRAKPALHPVAGHGISDFFGHRDTIADGVRGDGVVGGPFMGEQNKTGRNESLSAIRGEKIRSPCDDLRANHWNMLVRIRQP